MLESERQRIALLIVQLVNGHIKKAGRLELEEWAGRSATNRRLLDRFLDDDQLLRDLIEFQEMDGDAIWADLVVKIPELGPVDVAPSAPKTQWPHWPRDLPWNSRRSPWIWGGSAVVAGAVAFLLLNRSAPDAKNQAFTPAPEQRIEKATSFHPGQFKLLMSLPDGTTMDAGAMHEGDTTRYDNLAIYKTREGEIVYHNGRPGDGALLKDSTPRGGWYTVVLPDSSKVYLNAASSLSFKTTFGQEERTVSLEGEGYFKVAGQNARARKKPPPFIVQVQRAKLTKISASGTEFNVTAYGDDPFIKTTLLKGRVRVEDPARAQPIHLQPGEQYIQYKDGKYILIRSADTEEAVAWINDEFAFNEEPLTNIMRQIGRWYDVPVVYKDTANMPLTTSGSRKDSLSTVLRRLEGIGNIHFKIDSHRVVVFRP